MEAALETQETLKTKAETEARMTEETLETEAALEAETEARMTEVALEAETEAVKAEMFSLRRRTMLRM